MAFEIKQFSFHNSIVHYIDLFILSKSTYSNIVIREIINELHGSIGYLIEKIGLFP